MAVYCHGDNRRGVEARRLLTPSPGAVAPASRHGRRYTDAPPAARVTGQEAGESARDHVIGVCLRCSPMRIV